MWTWHNFNNFVSAQITEGYSKTLNSKNLGRWIWAFQRNSDLNTGRYWGWGVLPVKHTPLYTRHSILASRGQTELGTFEKYFILTKTVSKDSWFGFRCSSKRWQIIPCAMVKYFSKRCTKYDKIHCQWPGFQPPVLLCRLCWYVDCDGWFWWLSWAICKW